MFRRPDTNNKQRGAKEACKAIHRSPGHYKRIAKQFFLCLLASSTPFQNRLLAAPGKCPCRENQVRLGLEHSCKVHQAHPQRTGYCGNLACVRPQDKRSTRSQGQPVEVEQKGNCLSRKLFGFECLRSAVRRANRCITVYLVAPKLG